jgi:hypothetical protein
MGTLGRVATGCINLAMAHFMQIGAFVAGGTAQTTRKNDAAIRDEIGTAGE